LPIADRTCLL
jgi:hypothetical protein